MSSCKYKGQNYNINNTVKSGNNKDIHFLSEIGNIKIVGVSPKMNDINKFSTNYSNHEDCNFISNSQNIDIYKNDLISKFANEYRNEIINKNNQINISDNKSESTDLNTISEKLCDVSNENELLLS